MQLITFRRTLLSATALTAVLVSTGAVAATISGKVGDAGGQRALAGVEVELVGAGRSASTASDGLYRFTDVAPGTYTLRAIYAGAAPTEQSVTVASADASVSADIALGGGAGEVSELLVVGQLANLSSSISQQRSGDGVQSVLTRDAIGNFPDQNVAEAVRRAPGVNVLNDQGEGRFIAVRGLDPNLNAASINGVRVPSPEADVRSVALDVIPSELIESIEIKKTLTPDMDADTIGASIEINTTSAFDRKKPFAAVSLEGSYNDATEAWSPKASLDFSRTFGDRLGVAGGLSYYKRKFATDNIEADGWKEGDNGVVYADTLEFRDYDVERKRIGGSLSLDFLLNNSTTLYARGLYSVFEDQEYRRRVTFKMDEDASSGSATTAHFDSADGEITVERDLKDRFETQNIASLVIGGKTQLDRWTFDYSVAWSKAREKENGSLDPLSFERKFDDPGLGVTFNYADMNKPGYTITNGAAAFLDASSYGFEKLERTSLSLSQDEEFTGRFDVKREFTLSQGSLVLQAGAKARLRNKTYDLQVDVYDDYDGDFTLADVLGPQDYGLAVIDPVPAKGAGSFFYRNQAKFELNPVDTAFGSAVSDYDVSEDIYAGYMLARFENGPFRFIGGLRVEHTKNDVKGSLVELVEEGGTHNGQPVDDDTVFVTPVGFKRDYTDWLPSAMIRYEAAPNLVLRGGIFRSVVRPGIGKIAPRFMVEENDDGDREGEFGNPGLKPYEAWNYDLSAEWYFARNAVLSVGVFHKIINNFIVDAEFKDITFNGVYADEALIPINGDQAKVTGLEFNYQQVLDFLPGPLDGILVGFNYTYTDAKGDVPDGDGGLRSIPLPASSRNTYNATLGYEKGPLSFRVAASYRSGYLDELGGDAESDRYVKDHLQWDVSAKYRITPRLQVFGELVNVSDEPYVAYQKGPGGDRLLQYEEYSWTGKIGFKASF